MGVHLAGRSTSIHLSSRLEAVIPKDIDHAEEEIMPRQTVPAAAGLQMRKRLIRSPDLFVPNEFLRFLHVTHAPFEICHNSVGIHSCADSFM